MVNLLAWPFSVARAARRARSVASDVAHYLRGLGTRDDPRTHVLFTVPTEGGSLRMMLTCPGHIEDALLRDGTWEPHVANALAFFLRPGGTLIDVGANIGYHALRIARSRHDARVVAFEPNPSVRTELAYNVALNELANVDVRGCALGDRAGTVTLHAQRDDAYNRGSSSVLRNPDLGDRFTTVRVDLRRLDDEIGGARVDVVKIDTEGYESAVLRGAPGVIARDRPVVVFELESRFHRDPLAELDAIAAALPGYAMWELGVDGALAALDRTAVSNRSFRADVVALPPDRASF